MLKSGMRSPRTQPQRFSHCGQLYANTFASNGLAHPPTSYLKSQKMSPLLLAQPSQPHANAMTNPPLNYAPIVPKHNPITPKSTQTTTKMPANDMKEEMKGEESGGKEEAKTR